MDLIPQFKEKRKTTTTTTTKKKKKKKTNLRLTEWFLKQDPFFCCIQETHINIKSRHYLRVRSWKQVHLTKVQVGEERVY